MSYVYDTLWFFTRGALQYRISIQTHIKHKSREISFVHNIHLNASIVLQFGKEHGIKFQNEWPNAFNITVSFVSQTNNTDVIRSVIYENHLLSSRMRNLLRSHCLKEFVKLFHQRWNYESVINCYNIQKHIFKDPPFCMWVRVVSHHLWAFYG